MFARGDVLGNSDILAGCHCSVVSLGLVKASLWPLSLLLYLLQHQLHESQPACHWQMIKRQLWILVCVTFEALMKYFLEAQDLESRAQLRGSSKVSMSLGHH